MIERLAFFRNNKSRRPASRLRRRGLSMEPLEDRRLLHASGLEPTDFEQFHLELLNRARANPGNEAAGSPAGEVLLANAWIDGTTGVTGIEWEGGRSTAALNEGLPAATISSAAKQPLAFNLNAVHATRDYSERMAALNLFGHNVASHTGAAPGRTSFSERLADSGVTGLTGFSSENLAAFPAFSAPIINAGTAEDLHFSLFIDSGIAGRGHRINMMEDSFREVGIGLAADTDFPCCGGSVALVTQNFFSRSGLVFLTGVVFNDNDNNNFYTPGGEALGGVTIRATPTGGGVAVETQTFLSGGYSLPLANGTYNVTASGAFGTTASVAVIINGRNVKQDFVDPVGAGAPATNRIGIHRSNQFYLDVNGNGGWDRNAGGDITFRFGNPGDTPITGDWNGDGYDEVGIHRGYQFYLDVNGNGVWDGLAGGDISLSFGNAGDVPLVGDWNGDGTDEVGIYRGNQFYLDVNGNGAWNGTAGGDNSFHFGNSGDTPITGDWNGDGTDEIGIHRSNQFYLDANGNGAWDRIAGGDATFRFGNPGDSPLTGDWNGDGTDGIGIHRGNQFYLDVNENGVWNGIADGDHSFAFGNSGDTPLTGYWEPQAVPLLAAGGELMPHPAGESPAASAWGPIDTQAVAMWPKTDSSIQSLPHLSQLDVRIADAPNARASMTSKNPGALEHKAAADRGWFVVAARNGGLDFAEARLRIARDDGSANHRIDSLTAVLLEFIHELGCEVNASKTLDASLPLGVRRFS